MNYTDEEMIKMLTNKCPLQFCKIVGDITKQLAAQISYFVIRNGGKKVHIDDVLNYALFEAHLYAVKDKFVENTNVLGFVSQVAKNKFTKVIKGEKKYQKHQLMK